MRSTCFTIRECLVKLRRHRSHCLALLSSDSEEGLLRCKADTRPLRHPRSLKVMPWVSELTVGQVRPKLGEAEDRRYWLRTQSSVHLLWNEEITRTHSHAKQTGQSTVFKKISDHQPRRVRVSGKGTTALVMTFCYHKGESNLSMTSAGCNSIASVSSRESWPFPQGFA